MTKPSCKDCPKRHVGCHAKCKDYKDWANNRRAELEARRKEKDTYYAINEVTKGYGNRTYFKR